VVDQTVTITAVLRDQLSGQLGKVDRDFKKFASDAKALGQSLSGIFNNLTLAVGGFASIQGLRASIDAAEKQVQAEKAVSFALRGREEQLQKILKVTSDIQAASTTGDEVLLELASQFLAVGTSSEEIPRNLQAAVDTATALGVSIDSVGQSILAFQVNQAGLLSRRVPFLKQLQEEGRLAEEGVTALLDAFGGAALSDAETSFGRVEQKINLIGDASERVGKVVVELKAQFLEAALPAAEKFASFLESDKVRNGIKLVGSLAPVLVSIAVAASGVGVAIGAIKLGLVFGEVAGLLVTMLTSLLAIAAQVVVIGGIAGTIVVVTLDLLGLLDDAVGLIDDIVQVTKDETAQLRQVLDLVLQGKLGVEDLKNAAARFFASIATRIDAYVLKPAKAVFFFVLDALTGIIKFISSGVRFAVLGIIDLIQSRFLDVVQFIAALIDGLLGTIADAVEKIPGIGKEIADSLRTDLASSIPDSFFDLGPDVDKARKDAANALVGIRDSFDATLADIKGGIVEAGETVAAIEQEGAQAIADRLAESAREEQKRADQAVAIEKEKNDKIVADTQATLDRIAQLKGLDSALVTAKDLVDISPQDVEKLLSTLTASSQDQVRQLLLDEIQKQLDAEKISIEQFLQLRKEIEVGLQEQTLAQTEKRIAAQEELLSKLREERDVTQQTIDAGDNSLETNQHLVEVNGQIGEAAKKLLQLEQERQKTVLDTVAAEREQQDFKLGLADKIVSEVEEARQALQDKRAEIADLFSSGQIFPTEAISLGDQATAAFAVQLENAKQKLEELAAASPELASQLAVARAELDGFSADLESGDLNTGVGDFFSGISDGAKEAAGQFNDLGATGVQVGKDLVNGFTDGLVNVFIKGTESFNEFLGNFLQGIAAMLAKIALLKSLSGIFGLQFGSGGEVPAVGFDSGGEVPGPDVNKDVVNAKLTPKEWVIRRSSTGYYGRKIMNAINQRLIPRELLEMFAGKSRPSVNLKSLFAGGGEVGQTLASGGGGGSQPVRAFVFSDEQELERTLAGGEQALYRKFERDSGRFNLALGRRQGR